MASRIAQIIANLLTNAVKYSNDGTRIWITADDLMDSADSLALLLHSLGHEVHTAYDGER